MGYQPWYQKQTYPALQLLLNVEGNPDNITGLAPTAFGLILRNTSVSPVTDLIGTGTFTIVTANPAVVTYTFSAADVAQPFSGLLIVTAQFTPTGLAVWDPIAFVITAD